MNLHEQLNLSLEVEIDRAKKGDISSSKLLLRKAAKLISENSPLPPELSEWLSDGLLEAAESGDAKKAFNLNARRGRKNSLSEDMEQLVAEDIHNSKLGLHKAENSSGDEVGAYAKAAKDYHISANTAEKIYKKYEDGFTIDEELRNQE